MSDSADDLIFSVSADLTTIKRALNRLVGDVDSASSQISRKFSAAGSSMDKSMTTALQSRINQMVGIGTKSANEWSGALADQGKQLDMLRQKYNPLLAVIRQYQSAQTNLKTLRASGTIGGDEFSSAMSQQRQIALASIAAIKSRGEVMAEAAQSETHLAGSSKLSSMQLQALMHSARSVTEQIALGVPVTQALAGQLSHLSYVASGEGGVVGALKGIGSGVVGLAAAYPAVTLAIVAAGAAAAVYYAATHSGAERSAEDLAKQIDLIRGVAETWGQATPALSGYIAELDRAKEVADTLAAGRAAGDLGFDEVRKKVGEANVEMAALKSMLQDVGDTADLGPLTDAWNRLSGAVKQGRSDQDAIKDVQASLAQALASTGIPAIKKFADAFSELEKAIEAAGKRAQTFNDDAIGALSGGSNVQDITAGSTFRDERGVTHQTSTFTPELGPTPERRPNIELEGLPGEAQKQEAADKKAANAAEELKKKQADLMRTVSDRIAQTQQEIDLTGKYGVAADKARFALEEWQKAEKLNLSDDQKKALQEKIDQYGKLADTLAQVKLSQDLADKTRLAGMSARDQQIVAMQKQYGLPEDANSASGRQIGKSLDQASLADGIKTFETDFETGLLNKGEKIGQALGDAVKTSAVNAMNKALDSLFGQVANGLASLLTGTSKTGGSAAATGAVGLAGKLTTSVVGTAPVIPVTRSALPNLAGANQDVVDYIRKGAIARGMDPNIVLKGAAHEGLTAFDPSKPDRGGDEGSSFGPFQLHYAGLSKSMPHAGLGDEFTKATGLDARDPSTWRQQTDFSLDYAQKNGWSPWMGFKAEGIGKWQGIGSGGDTSSAADAVNKLAENSKSAAANVGSFGSSLGSVGSTLASGLTGGKGGASSWLSLLAGSAFSGSGQLLKSGGIGLFADGGHVVGPGSGTSDSIHAKLSNGEFVVKASATRRNRGLLEAINAGHEAHFADGGFASPTLVSVPQAPKLNARMAPTGVNSGQPGVLHVHIDGANGDDHVRTLVKQGVSGGLSQYRTQQQRGGFGDTQGAYNNRKA